MVLQAEDAQYRMACIGARVLLLEHPSLLPLRNPANCQYQVSPEHQAVVYLIPVLWSILPPADGYILLASAQCILHQHCVFPPFPGFQSLINPLPYLAGLGDVLGALEGHWLEDYEPLRVPAALLDSCEFRDQRLDGAAPNSPARRVVPPCGHHRQGSSSGLLRLVSIDPPTDVRSIIVLHPVAPCLLDPPFLLCGHVLWQIPCRPLSFLRLVCRLPRRCRRCCVCLS